MELKEKNNVWLFLWRFNQGDYRSRPNGLCSLFWGGLLGGLLFLLSAPFTLIAWGITKFRGKVYFKGSYYNKGPIGILNLLYTSLFFLNLVAGTSILNEKLGISLSISFIFGSFIIPLFIGVLVLSIMTPLYIYENFNKNQNISVLTKGVSSIWDKVCPRIEWKK